MSEILDNSQETETLANEVASHRKLLNELITKIDGIEALVTHDLPH